MQRQREERKSGFRGEACLTGIRLACPSLLYKTHRICTNPMHRWRRSGQAGSGASDLRRPLTAEWSYVRMCIVRYCLLTALVRVYHSL